MAGKTTDLARITIELTSPLAIGVGAPSDLIDSPFVTDANGLPILPGSSIAGVLRSHWLDLDSPPVTAHELFGYESTTRAEQHQGSASKVWVGSGHIHGSNDIPVHGLLSADALAGDPLLHVAAESLVRQHVRINSKGAADVATRGLFDEAVVARGHRFTLEVAIEDLGSEVMDRLLAIIYDPMTRLGGKTTRGMGRFKVVRARRRRFDLSATQDWEAFASIPRNLSLPSSEQHIPTIDQGSLPTSSSGTIRIKLKPRGTWLFGGGSPRDDDAAPTAGPEQGVAKVPDQVPFREPIVRWAEGGGRLDLDSPTLVVPATGIKGALRHRARFHGFALAGKYADGPGVPPDFPQRLDRGEEAEPPTVIELFGTVPPPGSRDGTAQRGALLFDEVAIYDPPERVWFDHLSIDRFTSGPLDGHLFTEMALWRTGGATHIELTLHIPRLSKLSEGALTVLRRTLEDLAKGRLQLGAGSGRGHGWMEGSIEWFDEASSLNTHATQASGGA